SAMRVTAAPPFTFAPELIVSTLFAPPAVKVTLLLPASTSLAAAVSLTVKFSATVEIVIELLLAETPLRASTLPIARASPSLYFVVPREEDAIVPTWFAWLRLIVVPARSARLAIVIVAPAFWPIDPPLWSDSVVVFAGAIAPSIVTLPLPASPTRRTP